jgi:hypothetical protein
LNVKRFIASFVKGQVLLLLPQPVLLALILLNRVSLYYSAPVIVSLAVLWGWFDYSGKAQRRGTSVLRKLERLVDDFGWLNFQEGGGAGNEMVVGLLDKASFGSSTLTTPQLATATTEKIKEVYFTLELWYFSMRQKVRLLLRKAASMIEYDLLEVVNEFVEFYGEFVEKVAEETLRLVAKGDLASLEGEREGFSTFKTRLAELRGRANAFLQSLRDDGLPLSDTKVRALELDPWFKTGTAISEQKQSPT